MDGTGHAPTVYRSERDSETMRDRYEELFPAYQQLIGRLARIMEDIERGETATYGKQDVEILVKKYEKWHAELSGIRIWFDDNRNP